MSVLTATLSKEERIHSKKLIDALFQGGRSHSLSAFPLRVVYMALENSADTQPSGSDAWPLGPEATTTEPTTQMLISVPKRCFKRAVKRNRVKRQVREAYRRNKHLLTAQPVAMAFIWLDARLHDSNEVEAKVVNLLRRINERLSRDAKQADRSAADHHQEGERP